MTVVAWMNGDWQKVTRAVARDLAGYDPLRADVEKFDNGEEFPHPVWVLGPCGVLQALHNRVLATLDALTEADAQILDMTYAGDKFRGHISLQTGQKEFMIGDRVVLPELSIISKEQGLNVVRANISL